MSTIEKAVEKLGKSEPSALRSSDRGAETVVFQTVAADETESRGTEPLKERVEETRSPREDAHGHRSTIKLPLSRLGAMGIITPDLPRSRIAEEYRTIKRPLLMNIAGKSASPIEHANLIMTTSALAGEGKTFSALNLAMSIAMEQDKTVLFVDADVAKASAGEILEIPDDRLGLIDLLEHDDLKVSDVLLHTSIPNLRVLPAGKVNDRSTELLASESMRRLMEELASRYPDRVIVFDSPPLLMTTESAVLANLMGQILFVVAAEETPQSAVTEAIQHLDPNKVIGMVLNKVKRGSMGKHGYGYGFGYGYGYGYGYGQSGRRNTERADS